MPTEVVKTIRSAGGDYTSLSAWNTAEARSLTTADEIAVAECYNDWPTGLQDSDITFLSGWSTDHNRRIVVRAANGHAHNGTPGSGFFIQCQSTGFQRFFDIRRHTTLSRIEWRRNPSEGNTGGLTKTDEIDGSLIADRCILSGAFRSGMHNLSGGSSGAPRDIIIGCYIHFGLEALLISAYDTIDVYNNIFHGVGSGTAINAGTGSKAENLFNNVFYNVGSPHNTTPTNAGNNATTAASGLAGTGNLYNITADDFVDATNNDFHLSATSGLRGQGANLYSDFQYDIDGDEWPSAGAWDIGFDYYVSAGPTYNVTLSSPTATATGSTTATVGCTVTYS